MVAASGKRDILANSLERTGAGALLSMTLGRWNGVVVFNYHRIGEPTGTTQDHAVFSASQEEFEQQVRFLKKNSDVIRVGDLRDALKDPRSKSVMVTFDDGYIDNYEVAFPILKSHNVPAVFFLTSGFLDNKTPAWWDEVAWMVRSSELSEIAPNKWFKESFAIQTEADRCNTIYQLLIMLKALHESEMQSFLDDLGQSTGTGRCPLEISSQLWMTWDMIREMDAADMDIGGHTVTHPVLANCDRSRQEQEIVQSKQRIEAELGHEISAFSYPVGQPDSFDPQTKQILAEAGYDWGFSFYGGYCSTSNFDPFDIKRMPVEKRVHRNLFRSIARLPQLFARK